MEAGSLRYESVATLRCTDRQHVGRLAPARVTVARFCGWSVCLARTVPNRAPATIRGPLGEAGCSPGPQCASPLDRRLEHFTWLRTRVVEAMCAWAFALGMLLVSQVCLRMGNVWGCVP